MLSEPRWHRTHATSSGCALQCDCGVGQYLLGQVRVVDCAGHGDRADKDTEGEDRLVFSDLAVGVVDEASQHGETFPHLVRIGGSG